MIQQDESYGSFIVWFDGPVAPSHTDSSAHTIAWSAWKAAIAHANAIHGVDLDRLEKFEGWLADRAGPNLHIDRVREALGE